MTRRLHICAILGSSCILAATTAPGTYAQSGWVSPVVVATGSPSATGAASVAMDAQGDTLVVWVQYDGESNVIEAAWRPAEGSFGAPVTLSPPNTSVASPSVAMDSRGDATIVWLAKVADSGPGFTDVEAALRSSGGKFTKLTEPLSSGAFTRSPVVAMDSQGDATVAWSEDQGGANIVYASFRSAGHSFTAPKELSEFLGDAQMPAVAMDDRADAAVAWTMDGSLRPIEEPLPLQLATRADEEEFGAFKGLSSLDAYHPTVAMDARGEIAIAWMSVSGEQAYIDTTRRNMAGEDRGEERIVGSFFSGAAPEIEPKLAMDEAGNAILAWEYGGAAFVAMQTPYDRLGRPIFGIPFEIDAPSASPGGGPVALAVNDRGDALLTWQGTAETGLYALGAAASVGDTAASGATLSEFSDLLPSEGEIPPVDVAIDAHGDGAAAWVSADGSDDSVEVAGYQAAGPQLEGLQVPAEGQTGEQLSFSVSPASVWSPTTSTSWSWGDGSPSVSGSIATHVYSAAGVYDVTVSATNAIGNLTLLTRTIAIHAPPGGREKVAEGPPEHHSIVGLPPHGRSNRLERAASPAFTPLFATHASAERHLLGTLIGITAISGAIAGERLTVRCTAGCAHSFRERVRVGRHRHARGELSITPPLELKSSTRIEIELQAPDRIARFAQYEFLRTRFAVIPRLVRHGCRSATESAQTCP